MLGVQQRLDLMVRVMNAVKDGVLAGLTGRATTWPPEMTVWGHRSCGYNHDRRKRSLPQ